MQKSGCLFLELHVGVVVNPETVMLSMLAFSLQHHHQSSFFIFSPGPHPSNMASAFNLFQLIIQLIIFNTTTSIFLKDIFNYLTHSHKL